VPQGSVLGSLLFILYTTPLRTVISNSSANHRLCADDTQLNSSFCHSLQLVFLTSLFLKQLFFFQTFPTGCLQISSHSILPKLNFSSLVLRSNSLCSTLLKFIFQTMSLSHMLILLVTLVSSLIKKSFVCSTHLLYLQILLSQYSRPSAYSQYYGSHYRLLLLSPHLSFIPKLITATLFFSIFLLLKSIVFSFFSTLLSVPSPELQNFHHITPILKSLHWLSINQIIQYKVLCLTRKHGNPFISDLFCHPHLVVLTFYSIALRLSSRLIVLQSLLVITFQIDPSITSLLSYGIVYLLTYVILLITLPLTLASLNSPPSSFSKI
jgi:hypothetical protein